MSMCRLLLLVTFCMSGTTYAEERIEVAIDDSVAMRFTWIPPGMFTMGGFPLDAGGWITEAQPPETPKHEVVISKGFFLGETEVTQEQWYAVMHSAPWRQVVGSDTQYVKDGPRYPAVAISWSEIQGFIEKLNHQAGSSVYRLPTEAEWEYACRAGSTTRWYFGDSAEELNQYEWNPGNTWEQGEPYFHEVGEKLPNPFGLYDMSGNVWEWVQDTYGAYPSTPQVDPAGPAVVFTEPMGKVFRGGSYDIYIDNFESACGMRTFRVESGRQADLGFRLVWIGNGLPTVNQDDSWGSIKSRIDRK